MILQLVLNAIKEMSVLDLSELVKSLEEEFENVKKKFQ